MREKNGKIKLKLSDKITFPDKCIFCGCDNPDGTVPLSPKEEESNGDERMILFAVPACTACAYSRAARERQIANVTCAIFLVAMTIAGALLLKNYYSLIYVSLGILAIAIVFSLDSFKVVKPLISIESIENSNVTFFSPDFEYIQNFREMNSSLDKSEHSSGVS